MPPHPCPPYLRRQRTRYTCRYPSAAPLVSSTGRYVRVRAVDEALLAERHERARAHEQRALHRARHRESPARAARALVCNAHDHINNED